MWTTVLWLGWGLVSQLQQQHALSLCSVLCWLLPFCHHLLDRIHSLLYTGLQIPASRYPTPDYSMIKAEPASPPHRQLTDGNRPSTLVSLTTQWPIQTAWSTVLH